MMCWFIWLGSISMIFLTEIIFLCLTWIKFFSPEHGQAAIGQILTATVVLQMLCWRTLPKLPFPSTSLSYWTTFPKLPFPKLAFPKLAFPKLAFPKLAFPSKPLSCWRTFPKLPSPSKLFLSLINFHNNDWSENNVLLTGDWNRFSLLSENGWARFCLHGNVEANLNASFFRLWKHWFGGVWETNIFN